MRGGGGSGGEGRPADEHPGRARDTRPLCRQRGGVLPRTRAPVSRGTGSGRGLLPPLGAMRGVDSGATPALAPLAEPPPPPAASPTATLLTPAQPTPLAPPPHPPACTKSCDVHKPRPPVVDRRAAATRRTVTLTSAFFSLRLFFLHAPRPFPPDGWAFTHLHTVDHALLWIGTARTHSILFGTRTCRHKEGAPCPHDRRRCRSRDGLGPPVDTHTHIHPRHDRRRRRSALFRLTHPRWGARPMGRRQQQLRAGSRRGRARLPPHRARQERVSDTTVSDTVSVWLAWPGLGGKKSHWSPRRQDPIGPPIIFSKSAKIHYRVFRPYLGLFCTELQHYCEYTLRQ